MIITSRRQQRLLAAIDSALRRSDPRLVARFAVFAQLTRDKAMPRVEQVTAGPVLLVLSAVVRELRVYLIRCRVRVRRRWKRAGPLVLIPAAAVVVLGLLVLLVRGNPAAACAPAAAGSHAGAERVMTLRGYWPGPSCPPGLVRGAPASGHTGSQWRKSHV